MRWDFQKNLLHPHDYITEWRINRHNVFKKAKYVSERIIKSKTARGFNEIQEEKKERVVTEQERTDRYHELLCYTVNTKIS